MEKIKITADSSCSLPYELLEELHISLLYLEIRFGDRLFQDCTEVMGNDLFEYHDQTDHFAEAIPIPLEAFPPFFEKFVDDYDHIIHIGSNVGSIRSYQNAQIAAKAFPTVTVVDAGQVSSGMGLVVLYAAALAKKGISRNELLSEIAQCSRKIYMKFLIGTMEYFYQSDRCSNLTRHATALFHMRSSITILNGKMVTDKMYQGSDETVKTTFIADFLKNIHLMKRDILILGNSGCSSAFIQQLHEKIASFSYFEKVLVIKDSAAISSHCGPNTFGMYGFYREEQKGRNKHEGFSIGGRRRHL